MTPTPDPNPPSAAVLDAVGEVVASMPALRSPTCFAEAADLVEVLRRRGIDVQPMMGGGDA